MAIIGIILGVTAIGLIFWFRKEYKEPIHFLEGEAEAIEHGYNALMKDFISYQVDTDRKINELEKQLEIKAKQLERNQTKLVKDLPTSIRKVIGHIEFARPLDNK